MSDDVIQVTRNGPVATVSLNRPDSYNAFNKAMRLRLSGALLELENDTAIRVVIVHGNGPGFSAGVDLKEPTDLPSHEVLEGEFRPFLECIWHSHKIYVAAVHGHSAGIAAALALACDLVVLEDSASLTLAFAAIGLIPDGGLIWHLNQALGPRKALEAILEGQQLSAEFCAQNGLANHVVATGKALSFAESWAAQLALAAPLAASAAKRLVAASATLDLGETFSAEAQEQTALGRSGDHRRGVEAFLNRQPPVFEGD